MTDSMPHTSTVALRPQAIPSVTLHFNITASPTLPFSSHDHFEPGNYNYYNYYDSVLYPSSCTICGLPHHPVPHTMMTSIYQTNTVESTPIPYLKDSSSFTMKMMGGSLPNHLSQISYSKNKRPHREMVSLMRDVFHKLVYICSSVLRPPRRHNIYPSQ